jgi:hypothetical protein
MEVGDPAPSRKRQLHAFMEDQDEKFEGIRAEDQLMSKEGFWN